MSKFYIRDVEQTQDQIARLTKTELFDINIHCMRKSLFKYFPNTIKDMNGVDRNFSKEALANNTVHLSAPSEFDDPYDCNVYVAGNEFALQRVQYYASLCDVNIKQEWDYAEVSRNLAKHIFMHISSGGKVASLFELDKNNQLVHAHQEYFLLSLEKELLKADADGESYYKAITDYNTVNN